MALVEPIAEVKSGSIGGQTFSRNKGGLYVKLKRTPSNPNTSRQQATRVILGDVSREWSGLTQAQRDAWEFYASEHTIKNALGNDITIAGQNWYCKCNARLSDAGLTALVLPPVRGAPPGLTTLDVSYQSTTVISFDCVPGTLASYECIQVLWTLANSMGKQPNINQSRMVGYTGLLPTVPVVMTLPGPVPTDLQSTFYAAVMNDNALLSAFQKDIAVND